jgi:hypothetical protein
MTCRERSGVRSYGSSAGGTEVNLVILDLPLGQEDGLDLRDCKDKHVILRVGHRLDGDNGAGADMGVSVRPSVVSNLTFL